MGDFEGGEGGAIDSQSEVVKEGILGEKEWPEGISKKNRGL